MTTLATDHITLRRLNERDQSVLAELCNNHIYHEYRYSKQKMH